MALFPPRVQSPSRGRLEFERREKTKTKINLTGGDDDGPKKKSFLNIFFQPNVFDSQQEEKEKVPTTTT